MYQINDSDTEINNDTLFMIFSFSGCRPLSGMLSEGADREGRHQQMAKLL